MLQASSDSKPGDERDEDDGDKVVVPDPPISTLAPIATADSQQVEETLIPTALPPQPQAHVESDVDAEEEDESAWDSDVSYGLSFRTSNCKWQIISFESVVCICLYFCILLHE